MRKLFLAALLIVPFLSKSQCPTWLGGNIQAAAALEPIVEQYTSFKLKMNDTTGRNATYLYYSESKEFVEMKIDFEQKKELRGTELVKLAPTVSSIYIKGPADKIDKMVKEYFEPLLQPCTPTTSPTWYMWDKYKLVYSKRGEHEGIPMKFIEISKQ